MAPPPRAPRSTTGVDRRARAHRAATVVAVVLRHGAAHGLDVLLGRHGPGNRRRARRLRRLLEDLGVAAIKIGQILSTRPDVLAPEYTGELARLQDAAPPEAPETIAGVVTAELGAPPDRVFTTFDPDPLAAASIGQAHAATHRDGTPVVVKVRRPGVVAQVGVDLDVLDRTARVVDRLSSAARRYDLLGLTRQFASTLRAELDYRVEAENARRFAAHFAGRPDLRIPRVYADGTTSRVITLERCFGTKPDDVAGLAEAGIDTRDLAARCADVMLTMIFDHGFFHADPHAGNFFVEPDGTIGLIDFGMVGHVDDRTRTSLAGMMAAVAGDDVEGLADAALSLGVTTGDVDRPALLRDLAALVRVHLDAPLGELRFGALLVDVTGTMRRHRLRLPVDLALLVKTFAMSEGLAARLDPDFRMAPAVLAHAQRFLAPPPPPTPPNAEERA